MLFDKADQLSKYKAFLPELEVVESIVKSGVLSTDPCGSYTTSSPRLRYFISEYETTPAEGRAYEFHKKEADVQVMVKGEEMCYYTSKQADFSLIDEAKGDIAFLQGKAEEECLLSDGKAVIYLPGELHLPSCDSISSHKNRKAVFKILMV